MKEREKDEILYRIDERTEQIAERLERHEQIQTRHARHIDELQSNTQKNTSDIAVGKAIISGITAMIVALTARVAGFLGL